MQGQVFEWLMCSLPSSVIDEAGGKAREARTPLQRLATDAAIGAAVFPSHQTMRKSIGGVTLRIDAGISAAGP